MYQILDAGVFDGSSNEQPSLKPLEQKVIKDFGFHRFIVCTDAGLASEANRRFNNINDRAFVVTQSLKKLKEDERISAMDDTNWKQLSNGKRVKDFQKIRENPEDYKDEIYYKERIHDVFNFRTDTEIVPTRKMREIIASTKK